LAKAEWQRVAAGGDRRSDLQRWNEARRLRLSRPSTTFGNISGLREQIQYIQNQQFDIIWRNYVHELFRDKTSPADQRRRRLILDLSKKNEPVPRHLLTTISPKVAHAYAQKTDRTLTRDLRELRKLDLIVRKIKGYVAKTGIIRAFLAPRHDASADAALENRITKRREIREAKSLQNKELQRS
jgi:hypothetical protein